MKTAYSGWRLMLLSLDFLTSLVTFKVAAGDDILTTQQGWGAHHVTCGALGAQLGSGSEPETRNIVDLGSLC